MSNLKPGSLRVIIEIKSIDIGTYTPAGEDKPTEVHLAIQTVIPGEPPMVMRLKSARVCNELIAALQDHRREVFGGD